MTVAYLIMAHEADAQLALLISTLLADERSRLYLHLDAKAGDLGAAAHLAADRLTVLDDRLVVNWGGYSIVAATQRLLARALREPPTTHFVLLSGS